MTLKSSLIAELRQLCLDGATPSQLMQRIATEHADDPRLHALVADYFREAFHVPLLRNVVAGDDYTPSARHAHHNRDLVPEIVQRVREWNSDSLNGAWLAGVTVRSMAEHLERLGNTRPEELDRVWDTLLSDEKLAILRKIAQKDFYWDSLKSVAALAERLQEKIVELEKQLARMKDDNSDRRDLISRQ